MAIKIFKMRIDNPIYDMHLNAKIAVQDYEPGKPAKIRCHPDHATPGYDAEIEYDAFMIMGKDHKNNDIEIQIPEIMKELLNDDIENEIIRHMEEIEY